MAEQAFRDTVGLPIGMQRTHLTAEQRIGRAALVVVPMGILAALIVLGNLDEKGLWVVAAILFGAGLVGGYAAWQKLTKVEPCYDVYQIPRSERYDKLGKSLLWSVLAFGGVMLASYQSHSHSQDAAIFGMLIGVFEGCYLLSVYVHRTRRVPPGKAETVGPQLGATVKLPSLQNPQEIPWFLRYAVAIGMVIVAYNLPDMPNKVWIPITLLLLGVLLMYEILGAIIVCALVYWFFGALAAVPTSVAVLIGAYWIAESNKKKG